MIGVMGVRPAKRVTHGTRERGRRAAVGRLERRTRPQQRRRQLPESGNMSRERQATAAGATPGVPPVPASSRALTPPVASAMLPVEPRNATALFRQAPRHPSLRGPEDAPPPRSVQDRRGGRYKSRRADRYGAVAPVGTGAASPTGAERNALLPVGCDLDPTQAPGARILLRRRDRHSGNCLRQALRDSSA